jgi:hypothetical protein
MKRPQESKTIIIAFVIIAVVLPIISADILFLGRGVIRSEIIPAYTRVVYRPSLENHFKKDFTPINNQLQVLGITMLSPNHDVCGNESAQYEGFSESVYCSQSAVNNQFTISSDFKHHWQKQSPNLQRYLETNGWKHYNPKQDVPTFFYNQGFDSTIGISYSKQHGSANCSLDILFNTSDPPRDAASVSEGCWRNVDFFGGY